ncbi:hypothetical protein JOS77_06740 [Chromobacterium haemolyticum]|nr:hypothetical protein JOS77_06740 [Chromobacterium haemolyticum]
MTSMLRIDNHEKQTESPSLSLAGGGAGCGHLTQGENMKPMSALLLGLAVSATLSQASAGPLWDEAAIVKSVGVKAISKKYEQDGSCRLTRYHFKKAPDMVLEFRCNRVNVAWDQYPEKGYEQKNKETLLLASRAAATLLQESGKEVTEAIQGKVVRNRPLSSGLSVGGSCVLASCLLTYR